MAWLGTTVIVVHFSILASGTVVVGTVVAAGTAGSSVVALILVGKATVVALES